MNISIEQKKINATLPKMLYISKIRYLKSKQLANIFNESVRIDLNIWN